MRLNTLVVEVRMDGAKLGRHVHSSRVHGPRAREKVPSCFWLLYWACAASNPAC